MAERSLSSAGAADCIAAVMGLSAILENQVAGLSGSLSQKAIISAIEGFARKFRKRPSSWPTEDPLESYFRHLLEVGLLLGTFQYPDEVVAAGLLHDHIEDLEVTAAQLADQFGHTVSDLVALVSQPSEGTWEEKREKYFEQLSCAPDGLRRWARAISCADKVSNMRSSNVLAAKGYPPDDYLSRRWDENRDVWEKLRTLFDGHVHPMLVARFDEELRIWIRNGQLFDLARHG